MENRPIIAVITCHKNQIAAAAQRETWAHDCPVKFFYGEGCHRLLPDEVQVDAPDTYIGLPHKVQAAVRWALQNRYTHFFKCDDDAYVVTSRLFSSGFDKAVYTGRVLQSTYCHGGAGYWLNESAMRVIADASIDDISEDGWVATKLRSQGILPTNDVRYTWVRRVFGDPVPKLPSSTNSLISVAEFAPQEMKLVHRCLTRVKDPTDDMSADEYKAYVKRREYELGHRLE